jgi:hypothetical protein
MMMCACTFALASVPARNQDSSDPPFFISPGKEETSMASKQDQLLVSGLDAFSQYIRQSREFRTRELIDEARRVGAAARKRRRTLVSVAKKVGLDLASVDLLHDKDWELVLKQVAKQGRAAVALAKQRRASERQVLRTVTKHRERFEYRKGNPHTSICIWQEATPAGLVFTPQTFSDGVARLLTNPAAPPPRVGQNIRRFSAEVTARAAHDFHLSPVAAADIFTRHLFVATVPHAGVLSVTANYVPSGTIFLGAPGDCVAAGSAGAEVLLFMFVTIITPDGGFIELPLGATQSIVDQEVSASCDGKSRLIQVGTINGVAFQLAHNNIIAVEAGDLVGVSAGFDIFISGALRGDARATFDPQPFGLNVPMVLLRIDS